MGLTGESSNQSKPDLDSVNIFVSEIKTNGDFSSVLFWEHPFICRLKHCWMITQVNACVSDPQVFLSFDASDTEDSFSKQGLIGSRELFFHFSVCSCNEAFYICTTSEAWQIQMTRFVSAFQSFPCVTTLPVRMPQTIYLWKKGNTYHCATCPLSHKNHGRK